MKEINIASRSIPILKQYVPEIAGAWLFGSAASGGDTEQSDIDLAILLSAKTDKVKIWQCAEAVASEIGRDVDIIDMNEASTIMRAQILNNGKRIYCADKYRCDLFETEALTDYVRFNEERKEILEDIKTRGKVYSE